MNDDLTKTMGKALLLVFAICFGAMLLLASGCSVVTGDDNAYNEGDGDNRGNTITNPAPTPEPTPEAEASGGLVFLILGMSVLFSGCINSQVTFSPVASIGVNSGNMGSGTGMGTDEETGVHMNPKVEREGGASVSAEVAKPDAGEVLPEILP